MRDSILLVLSLTYLWIVAIAFSWGVYLFFTNEDYFFLLPFLICAPPYMLLLIDFRNYLRYFRRALVLVTNYTGGIPAWVAREALKRKRTPRCLSAFGLDHPCTLEDLLDAYREEVKTIHPDRGGSREAFLQLQRDFEEARTLLEGLGTGNTEESDLGSD